MAYFWRLFSSISGSSNTSHAISDSLIGKHRRKVEPSNFERTFRILVRPNNFLKKIRSPKKQKTKKQVHPLISVGSVFFLFRFSTKATEKPTNFPDRKLPPPKNPPAVALQGYQANLVPKRRFASAHRVQTTTPSARHPRGWAPVDEDGPGGRSGNGWLVPPQNERESPKVRSDRRCCPFEGEKWGKKNENPTWQWKNDRFFRRISHYKNWFSVAMLVVAFGKMLICIFKTLCRFRKPSDRPQKVRNEREKRALLSYK